MINIKPKKGYLTALESVAMTDIVLNMFIFFFISFSLIYTFSPTRLSKIEVSLPKASSAISLEGSERVILTITDKGTYYINDDKVKSDDLKEAIEKRQAENPGMSLLMRVDGAAKFEDVANALDVINELNIQKVSVAADRED